MDQALSSVSSCTCSLSISPLTHHLITSLELIVLHRKVQRSYHTDSRAKSDYIQPEVSYSYIKVTLSSSVVYAWREFTSKVNGPQYLAKVHKTAKGHQSQNPLEVLTWRYLQQRFLSLAGSNNSATFRELNSPPNAFQLIQNRTSGDNLQTNVSTFSGTSCRSMRGKPEHNAMPI